MNIGFDPSLAQQLAYYGARAAEYDEWWHRQGRYDHGPVDNQRWFDEADQLDRELERFNPRGQVLELACGTGLRTRTLLPYADAVTAVDGSHEMLLMHKANLDSPKITRVRADLFEWFPDEKFDVVYFGFWLSHVPPERFDAFWRLVRKALKPDGRFFFVDSKRTAGSAAVDHVPPDEGAVVHHRRVNDGREFQVYKVFYQPDQLQRRLAVLGWDAWVDQTATFFIHGHGSRTSS